MMKKIIPLTVLLLLSFKADDLIEIEQAINARSSADFMKTTNNIRTTLKKGTIGKVVEVKKLPSGNYGVKLNIETGPFKKENMWVYYNVKNPSLKLKNKTGQEISEIEQSHRGQAVRDIASIKDPVDQNLTDSVRQFNKINPRNLTPNLTNIKRDCIVRQELSPQDKLSNYDVTQSVAPFKEIADGDLHSLPCRTNEIGVEVCKTDSGVTERFSLRNSGPNNVVKSNEYYINRQFDFEFEEMARSDMKLVVSDSPDEYTSHATYSVMMFFPRTVLPSVKKVDNVLEVTLPNQEVVKYDATTKEIIGGVIKESPMAQDERKRAKPAGLTYTGAGVMIRTDKAGDLPIGDTETGGKTIPSISTTTISKKGYKDCKIPAKDIWYTDYKKAGNVFIKKELATDEGMDNFLRSKCGFSMFN
jgi:hypothetical protein